MTDPTTELKPTFGEDTINEFVLKFKQRQINLEPGFQRNSVWSTNDRRRLIESILQGYPVPSVFLYKRDHNGKLVYDVIDGKQRLESILMFKGMGRFRRDQFPVRVNLGDGLDWYYWSDLPSARRVVLDSYKLQTVEVTGDLPQIIDLFVRINSTGKRLTSAENRHARYYTSRFLREADRLVVRNRKYLEGARILSKGQIQRMKGTELVAELLMSIYKGGPINKKTALDRTIGNADVNGNTLTKLVRQFTGTLNRVKRMFPDLRQTRFRNTAEFYSLFMLVWELEQDGLVLTDPKRNRVAAELLRRLSTGVDELRERLRKAEENLNPERIFQEYVVTVQGDTDSSATRDRRAKILRGLLRSLFEPKDSQRIFSSEQRRIIWHSDESKKCARCRKPLTWTDFTVDHVKAWSKGGATSRKNAKPMHRRCNSSKGARAA